MMDRGNDVGFTEPGTHIDMAYNIYAYGMHMAHTWHTHCMHTAYV